MVQIYKPDCFLKDVDELKHRVATPKKLKSFENNNKSTYIAPYIHRAQRHITVT